MIGKKVVVLILLAIFIVRAVLPLNQAYAQAVSTCDVNLETSTVLSFVTDILADGLKLLGSNIATSFLSGLPIVGGLIAPVDQAIDFVFNWWMLALLFGALGSLAVALTGGLVNYALALNANLTTNNVVVDTGYGIILALVNLGFVAAIVVMAFSTMFRRSSWDAKSSLAKLIIAVLLINFSMFFAEIILNISTELTKVLISNGCADSLVSHFNIITINTSVDQFLKSGASNFMVSGLLSITSIFFASLLTIIGAVTLLGIFLFLIVRYVVVMVLLIFMPVMWLGFIFPKLQIPGVGNAWSGWWGQFLKWVLNGPIMAFFLYLTVMLINNIGPNGQLTVSGAGPIQIIAQMLVVVALSLAGLYAANKLSITGAAFLYGGVAKIGAKGLAGLKATGVRIATAPFRSPLGQKILGGATKGKLNLFGLKIPTGTKEIGRLGMRAEAYTRKQAEAGAKKYDGLTDKEKNQVLSGMNPRSAEYAKLMEGLLKSGELDMKLAKEQLTDKVKLGLALNKKDKIYKDLEKFALNTSESIKATVAGIMSDASEATKKLVGEVKDNEWGKKFKINKVFEDIKQDDFKDKNGILDRVKHDKAIQDNKWERERLVRAIQMHQPEKLEKVYKSLSAGDQRINFLKAIEDSTLGSLDSNFNQVDFSFNKIPKRTQDYLTADPAPIIRTILKGQQIKKLFKNIMGNPPKDAIERDELEGYTKKEE